MDEETVFTVDEIAAKLKVNRSFVYRHAKSGLIPCHRIGRTIRFTNEDFRNILTRPVRAEVPN